MLYSLSKYTSAIMYGGLIQITLLKKCPEEFTIFMQGMEEDPTILKLKYIFI